MKNNTIEIYRRRIAIAALERMKRKTGAHRLTVSMPDGDIQFIDIDEASMLKLLQRFEKQALNEFAAEAETFIRQTYMKSVDINGHTEYLTETGKMIVDEIFSELIKHAKEKYVSGGIN
ncbi:hypothetical protein PQY04_004173 [Salmonella enterica]|uniref:Uncharacterized protein n=1 Tax=Salmonella enterica TaxID=28901 RepID=A0A3J3C5K7_SALER|nr:hypothetical protein [Salmonella enterica]ECU4770052.1 hypothetical protein [Salmonella enterica subsp. enterica]EDQ1017960.1 hypothetical protein [Salmonella enterica subsp. houtenae serovar 50:z4,z23:-]EDV3253315.1 hypothetical protein [Salmonella enterica subsp. houtenae]EEE1667673.1 hypothetical protein [Salmonella enterica subsp. houtenae serovar 48:z4,z32:-]HAE7876079.1 hypothetical protein [Salmonella enterica subsp. enterica serovar 1,9,12:-:-]